MSSTENLYQLNQALKGKISAITGKPEPTFEEKNALAVALYEQFRQPKTVGEFLSRPPGVWPMENTPKEWIDREDPNFQPSLYGENPLQVDVSGSGVINPIGRIQKSLFKMTKKEFENLDNLVYHGAKNEYKIKTTMKGASTGNPTSEFGAFFTPRLQEAERYVDAFHGGKGKVLPAIVDLKKPYKMSFIEFERIIGTDWKKLGVEGGLKEIRTKVKNIKSDLIRKGHDGIVVGERGKWRPQEIIAFDDSSIVQHKFTIKQALSEGKSVPKKVLKDYPELKNKSNR